MKKQKVGWAVVIAALGMAIMASSVAADITYSVGGVGDALIFPFFDADKENIVCISNESPNWIQVHVRLRTGMRSIEGRDFPLILSPGDVSVFVVTRNGYDDGLWRVEWKDLDPENFQYVRTKTDGGIVCLTAMKDPETGVAGEIVNRYEYLEPSSPCQYAWDSTTKAFDEKYGYIEVIGEAVFECDAAGNCGDRALNKNTLLSPSGCNNAWNYVNRQGGTLSGVPNVLYGKMYILDTERGTGVAYNATAFSNFRTNNPDVDHRVENYPVDTEVILISENAAENDGSADDYTYRFKEDLARAGSLKDTPGALYEAMVSVNNTWGSTLADGDDYFPLSEDSLDQNWLVPTSVRELELAIRRPSVRGHYFNNYDHAKTTGDIEGFTTCVFITLPTKHHDAMDMGAFMSMGINQSWETWKCASTGLAKGLVVNYETEIWDINEHTVSEPVVFDISPLPPGADLTKYVLTGEMNKIPFTHPPFESGRFVIRSFEGSNKMVMGGTIPCIALNFIETEVGGIDYMTGSHY